MARGLPPGGPESARGRIPERPVSRVLFPRRVALARAKIIPLGRPLLGGSSTLTRTPHRGSHPGDRADRSRRCPYSSLLREGLAPPPVTRLSRVGSYPTFSPLPVLLDPEGSRGHRRCLFCGAFPRVTPGRRYRPPCPVEPGLSSRERWLFTGDLPAASGGPAHPNRVLRLRQRPRSDSATSGGIESTRYEILT